ncbi:glycosyltransferase [Limibacter armeniacum]|uniref:glycosyltransferase n=1 Tax=Limibacter armeniacum TaxID=466084 RepID=UPI002FE67B6E
MKKNKILFVVTSFPTLSETFIVNQIVSLINKGCEVSILCTGHVLRNGVIHPVVIQNSLMDLVREDIAMPINKLERVWKGILNIMRYYKDVAFLLSSFNIFKYGVASINLRQLYNHLLLLCIKESDCDVMHVHFGDNAVLVNDLLCEYDIDKKMVVTFHGYDAHDFSSEFYRKLKQSRAYYTSNTNFTKNELMRLGFDTSLISVLPVGLDTSFFSPQKKTIDLSRDVKIVFVGRLVKWKGCLFFIELINEIIAKGSGDVEAVIIGDGVEYSKCVDLISKLNLGDKVVLKGSLLQDEIIKELDSADIFLYPGGVDESGRCENQGLVIQEAQSMGLPVIVSNIGGMPESINHGVTGFVIDYNDKSSFVETTIKLIKSPELRKQIGKCARNFVIENYDNKVLADEILDIYAK